MIGNLWHDAWFRTLRWALDNPLGALLSLVVLFGGVFVLLTRSADRTEEARAFILGAARITAFYVTFLGIAALIVGIPFLAAVFVGRYFGREDTALTLVAVLAPFLGIPVFYYAFKLTGALANIAAVLWEHRRRT
jgi:hypothetical protein